MSAFTFPSPGVNFYASQPSSDSYTKASDAITSDRINGITKFLAGSDWSSLSSLSPPTATTHAIVEDPTSWLSTMSDAPLFPTSAETIQPTSQGATSSSTVTDAPAFDSSVATVMPAPTPSAFASPALFGPALTPPHRQSFDTCYSDSVGSPDSERDFLTSPSMLDDVNFEFDEEHSNDFPLFPDQFEDVASAQTEDPVNVAASDLENVKLEAGEQESQLTDDDFGNSQSTVMPSQSQVKTEEDHHDSHSTLEAFFKNESIDEHLEPKHEYKDEHEHELWSVDRMQPYFANDETKAAVLSTLANALGNATEPTKKASPTSVTSASIPHEDEQLPSQVGPVRSSRGNRQRRSSPIKSAASATASPAPFIDPVTNTKRWQCEECGKTFNRNFNLKTHQITHQDPATQARPFVCPDLECGKDFVRKHDMQRHFENVHRGESRRVRGGSVKRSRSRAGDLGQT